LGEKASNLQINTGAAFTTQTNRAEVTPGEATLQDAKEQLEELVNPINMVETAARSIGTAFTDSFKSVIDGTATTQEALADMFYNIADAFYNMAAEIITQLLVIQAIESAIGIFGGGGSTFTGFSGSGPVAYPSDLTIDIAGFRAEGGSVSAGSPYVVGEMGPELFVPGRSGTIVPNSNLGGSTNVVVNVDAAGSKVQGDDQNAKQLGTAISAAVQQELIKQKRPGGLLA
jgi:phage-related minor tail protein